MNSIKEKNGKYENEWNLIEKSKSVIDTLNKKNKDKPSDIKLKIWNNVDRPLYSGMYNLGNTCYMNAILQCLLHTEDLINYIVENEKEIKENHLEISESFYNLYENYFEKKEKDFISPDKFRATLVKRHSQFDNFYQHDSHELLTLILDGLITESKLLYKKHQDNIKSHKYSQLSNLFNNIEDGDLTIEDSYEENSVCHLKHIFYGKLNSSVKCLNCSETNKTNKETFSILGLPIPIEYRLYIYFIPLKSLMSIKLCLKVTENMLLKGIINKIGEVTKMDVSSGIFYSVYKEKLQRIHDMNESITEITNTFLFFRETRKEIINKVIYFVVYFTVYDEDLMEETMYFEDLSKFKISSFPRIFLFEQDDKITHIFTEISEFTTNYIEKDDYFLVIKSIKSDNSQKYECLFCHKLKSVNFYCGCIKNFQNVKNCFLEKLSFRINTCLPQIDIHVLLKRNRIKYKELNISRDLSHRVSSDTKYNLDNLMNYFTEEEKLDDKITCTNCNGPQNSMKKLEYSKFPNILIFSLKRFKLNFTNKNNKKNYNFSEKLNFLIDFPIDNLDLSKYNSDSMKKYELYAVCYHHGNINSGHYTTVCKINNIWFEFNDKNIKEFNQNEIVNEDAYILFYQQKKLINS